jgi:hypothetical protein
MEEEKNIFDATEYILIALNTITNYDEFIEYKKEIEKAVNDIRNSLSNIKHIKHNNKYNKSSKNKSNISSILGLKYNYDSYFTNGNIEPLNNNTNFKDENIIFNKSIRNNFKSNSMNKKTKKNNNTQIKKDKFSKVADIIMKLNSEDYYYVILTKLFGKDLKDKLMSNEVSEDLLTAVTNSINEIESLKKKDDMKNLEEMEELPRQFPSNEILGTNNNYINYNKRKEEKGNYNNIYTEFNFVKNLRKSNNKSAMKEKPFISTTSIYGNYFDPPLQKGGISKLDDYKK